MVLLPAPLRTFINWLAGPRLLFWLLPALMLLITVGTIAQKYVGLYIAEKTFFSSFIFLAGGWLPLPGGYLLMGLFTLSLTLKFLLKSQWTRARAGINLAHMGVILLFAGGIISSLTAQDGAMTIAEGSTSAQVHDYHQRELMLVDGTRLLAAVPYEQVQAGRTLDFAGYPLRLHILSTCRNCNITRRSDSNEPVSDDLRGMARGMAISDTKPNPKDEANTTGLTFRIDGLSGDAQEQNGTYILFEDGPATKLTLEGRTLELVLGKQQRTLPFQVKLVDVVKVNYPGTDTAKSYHSDVIITDGAVSWPARIEMNGPLRYRGYTFYQSSFMQAQDQELTVLAVSKDAGQFLPYLGTLILAIGLLMHIYLRRVGEQP